MQAVKMSFLKRLQGSAFTRALMAIVFLTSGFVICVVQLVLYVFLRSWYPKAYRKINYYLTYSFHSEITYVIDWWAKAKSQLFVDPSVLKKHLGKEHAYLICNHGLELEGFLLWTMSERLGMLGNIRGMIKKSLSYAPICGWSWYLQEQVLVERNWDKDKRSLATQLKNLTSYPDPTWLTIFPEGTRFTQKKHEISMSVAREKGLPELKHLLLPRTKGFVVGFQSLRQKFPAVYDITVVVDEECKHNATFYGLFKGEPLSYKIALRRYASEELPQDEKELAGWLHKRFQEKDNLIENMHRCQDFNPLTKSACSPEMKKEFECYQYMEVPRRKYSMINTLGWAALILGMLFYYMWTTFANGRYLQLCFTLCGFFVASCALEKVVDLSRLSKASSYGQANS